MTPVEARAVVRATTETADQREAKEKKGRHSCSRCHHPIPVKRDSEEGRERQLHKHTSMCKSRGSSDMRASVSEASCATSGASVSETRDGESMIAAAHQITSRKAGTRVAGGVCFPDTGLSRQTLLCLCLSLSPVLVLLTRAGWLRQRQLYFYPGLHVSL